MSGCNCKIELADRKESKALKRLLAINAVMFVLEVVVGLLAQSTAVLADSLDMLADATVYGITLYAVGRSVLTKAKAAQASGVMQILLGSMILVDIVRRLISGSEPVSLLMIGMGGIALLANVYCLTIIARHRHGEVHMRASWIFSKNDVIANLGIIAGGLLVLWLDSPYPDLIIGAAIASIVIRGGIHIVNDAVNTRRTAKI